MTYLKRKLLINGKEFYPFKECLVFDIEGKKLNLNLGVSAENVGFSIWGAYSYKTDKIYFGKTKQGFQELLNQHRIIIGHNIKYFDIPVMKRDLGLDFSKNFAIDLLETLRKPPTKAEKIAMEKKGKKPMPGKGRAAIIGEARIIGIKDNRFPDFKLSTIAKHGYQLFKDHPEYSQYFEDYKIEDFDYSIFNKENISEEEWNKIKIYLKQDIKVTKNIFEFMEKYFEQLAYYLKDEDINNLEYIHCSTGKYAYKVMCKELNLPEEYDNAIRDKFEGAFVYLPENDKYTPKDGDGYCFDFTSQHPSHIHSMNLCTPAEKCKHKINGVCPTAHSGDGKIFNLTGTYCACEKGDIEKVISKWLQLKIDYKKAKDPREYTIKILINGTYGFLSSPIFKSLYYSTTGPDTTRMSKQSTKFMIIWVTKYGYKVVSSDTDSIYLFDPFNDKEKLIKIINEGVAEIKKAMPFSDDRYKMGMDAEFTHIFFFQDEKSKEKLYKKKNYIYITKEGKLKILGLPVIKSSAPLLARTIFINHLEKEILRKKDIKFDKEYLTQLIEFYIKKDKNILITKLRVNPSTSYASESQLQAQVSQKYLEGKEGYIELIKHNRKNYGVGKGKRYCSKEEAKDLNIRELDLETVWSVLEPFIKKDKQMNLSNF